MSTSPDPMLKIFKNGLTEITVGDIIYVRRGSSVLKMSKKKLAAYQKARGK